MTDKGPGTKDYWITTCLIGTVIVILLLDAIYGPH